MRTKIFRHSYIRTILTILGGAIVCAYAIYRFLILPPAGFPLEYHFTITHGQSLFSISRELHTAQVIRSPRVFEMLMLSLGSDKQISEGEYYFERPITVLEVAMRISGKQFGIAKRKVTFPEGFSTIDMRNRLVATFPDFDDALFDQLAQKNEGYLFPDTYGWFGSTRPDVMIATMRRNFDTKTAGLTDAIAASGHSLNDIVIMASLIEKEANGPEDRALVSGILWKRISINMPLQVDAPFLRLLGKESKDLTKSDLAMKSPYNTYVNKGLPPTPINNPGIESIRAALFPVESPYLYYLHDSDGTIHYGRTYAEHMANIKKYLT